jgi:hypothetical protein
VCATGVLINVLSLQTYTAPGIDTLAETPMDNMQNRLWHAYDINGLSEDDRKRCCLARGQSFELVAWLNANFTTGLSNVPIQAMFSNILVNMCKMLCHYKWSADKHEIDYRPDFTLDRLRLQITEVLAWAGRRDPTQVVAQQAEWNPKNWKLPMPDSVGRSILPTGIEGVHFQKVVSARYQALTLPELCKMGETALDSKFAQRLEVKREIIGMSWISVAVY